MRSFWGRWMQAAAIAAVCASAISASSLRADVRLPKVFGDHMVLQQKSQVAVWGWADAGEDVSVTLGGATATAKAGADGKWRVQLATPEAGGPHELAVNGKNEVKLTDVLIGEVWIASGQSNMEWPVAASTNPAEEAKNGDHRRHQYRAKAHQWAVVDRFIHCDSFFSECVHIGDHHQTVKYRNPGYRDEPNRC